MVCAATLYAAGSLRHGSSSPSLTEVSASGAVSISDSKAGGTILNLPNFAPGRTGVGEVTIANTGSAAGDLTLSSFDRSDSPGFYGGALSGQLELALTELAGASTRTVYAGQLWEMPELDIGILAAGGSRTYRFAVTMRDEGAPVTPFVGDNLYQRASTSLGYQWTLSEVEAGPPSEPPPSVPPPSESSPPSGSSPSSPASSEPPPTSVPPVPGDNLLVGTSRPDRLVGTPGDDVIRGLGAGDAIFGGDGEDRLFGGAGPDSIRGGAGPDLLSGGAGNDRLWGDGGRDRILGGAGSDAIFARDGESDIVACGPGTDVAYVDATDKTTGCERVVTSGDHGR